LSVFILAKKEQDEILHNIDEMVICVGVFDLIYQLQLEWFSI